MLKFNGAWRFDSPGPVPSRVMAALSDLIGKIASQGDRQTIFEHFKSYFAGASGTTASWSSSASWAETDLDAYMRQAAANEPLFIEAFHDACQTLQKNYPDVAIPDWSWINRMLAENGAGFEIQGLNLIPRNPHAAVVVAERPASLDEQAQELIQNSLKESERFLAEGRPRQAVQEILWLLETVATAFQGLDVGTGTIQGKYFNKIAEDLRRHHRGQTLDQVLLWVTTLHGYLSSPTGGGIRHGTNLREGIEVRPNEARLFCNLIRSYISFLMAEHERISKNEIL